MRGRETGLFLWASSPRHSSSIPAATLKELRFPSPGLRAKHATLGKDIKKDSNSAGVAISRRRYPDANPSLPICRGIIQLSITPTAKRNSYRVAILVGALPRVAGHARNPGLCNRNSVRVAGGAYHPTAAPSTDLHLHLNTVGKCVSNLETLIGCSALFMANAAILISNSAKIMTVMVMIMMSSGNGAAVLRVGATALAAVAMVMAGS